MNIHSEAEMLELGNKIAKSLQLPCVIELVGDVGAGKTTLVRGLAQGLDIKEPITSPTFVISKRYNISPNSSVGNKGEIAGTLIHYDFYRLSDPGIMSEELAEAMETPNSLVIVEWAESVSSLLPDNTIRIKISLEEDGGRHLESENLALPQ